MNSFLISKFNILLGRNIVNGVKTLKQEPIIKTVLVLYLLVVSVGASH